MKTLFSLLTIYLMTNGGGCDRPAEFVDNSRVVVEGTVLDSLQKPIPNQLIYFSNGIQSSEIKTQPNGNFHFSLPGTNKNPTLQTGEKIISFDTSKDNSCRIIYPNILVIDDSATYLNVKLIIK